MDEKNLKYFENDKWYHGTTLKGWLNICEEGIKVDYNKGNSLDFGYGFYLTTKQNLAESYINRLMTFKNKPIDLGIPLIEDETKNIAVIIEFNFKPIELINDNYRYKVLNKFNDEFADFVFHNRVKNIKGEDQHEYDLIYGVMSDSNPTVLIPEFLNSQIKKEDVIEGLKKSNSMKQLSLHNQDICDIIKPIRAYIYNNQGNEADREELSINDYKK